MNTAANYPEDYIDPSWESVYLIDADGVIDLDDVVDYERLLLENEFERLVGMDFDSFFFLDVYSDDAAAVA